MFFNLISTIIALLSLVLSLDAAARYNNVVDVDFIQSMTDDSSKALEILNRDPKSLQFFQQNYEVKKPSKMQYRQNPIIPKVMHQVWDGPIPPLYQHYLDECKKLHPDWEFKIWSENDMDSLELKYRHVYDQMRNYPGKSDIFRYEILYKFGGVYRDMDVKCYRPLDGLNHLYDFYAPLEAPAKEWSTIVVNNGIIGAAPQHEIIAQTLKTIDEKAPQAWQDFDEGKKGKLKINHQVMYISLWPLTEAFIKVVNNTDKSIALPTSYLMPVGFYGYSGKFTKIAEKIFQAIPEKHFTFIKPESLMCHNFKKIDIVPIDFDTGNGISDLERRFALKQLPPRTKQQLKIFADLYSQNHPSKASWGNKNRIPKVINFIIFSYDEAKQLAQNIDEWKVLNADFDFVIWNTKKLLENFKELKQLSWDDETRLYAALKILFDQGGHYADFRAKPLAPIFELGNKYDFYAGLLPTTPGDQKIKLSSKLLGSSAQHTIIAKTLEQFEKEKFNISDSFVNQAYNNAFIGGKNIIMPAVYFEPLHELPTKWLYQPYYYFVPKSFSKIYGYSIVY